MASLPYEIQQGIGRQHVPSCRRWRLRLPRRSSHSRPDDAYQNDPQDDGANSGGHVEQDRPESDPTRHAQVQGADGGHDGRNQQRYDQTLEHAEEEVAGELEVHDVSLGPLVLGGPQGAS